MSASIDVARVRDADPLEFEVTVREGQGETRHRVTLAQADFVRLSAGGAAEGTIEAAFRFLLDREPKEAILRRFDVSVISTYFPEFEQRLTDYLA